MDWSISWETIIVGLTLLGAFLGFAGRLISKISSVVGTVESLKDDITDLKSSHAGMGEQHDSLKEWQSRTEEKLRQHDLALAKQDEGRRLIHKKIDEGFANIGLRIDTVVDNGHSSEREVINRLGKIEGKVDAMNSTTRES